MKKVRTPDLRKLARRQRWMLWLVLLGLASQFLPALLGTPFDQVILVVLVVVQIAVYILLILGVVLLLTAEGNHPAIVIPCAIVMVAPCANLLVLAMVNMSATRTLRRAGLRVGFMGARDEDVERVLDPSLCKGCSYNLTGNVSGICPECGRPIAPAAT
ncbi:MAG: hypothetical protein HY763_15435 [Planctomycetes bacterium]|nr:hypothetical protein [Planctomycetota bacterium]